MLGQDSDQALVSGTIDGSFSYEHRQNVIVPDNN